MSLVNAILLAADEDVDFCAVYVHPEDWPEILSDLELRAWGVATETADLKGRWLGDLQVRLDASLARGSFRLAKG